MAPEQIREATNFQKTVMSRGEPKIMNWRRNGATKYWKSRPTHFRIPVKYGLYSYGYVTHENQGEYNVISD